MLKVIVVLVMVMAQPLPGGKPDVQVKEGVVDSVEDCLGVIEDFLSHNPAEFKAKAIVGGCRVEDNSTPA